MALSAEGIAPAGRQMVRCIVFIALALVASVAYAASYVYDANGRLRAVTADSGGTGEYVYDALGNILAIDNVPAGQLAIFAFVPNHGPVGATVTVAGQGFSTVPGNNALTFNGTPATVLSATTTQLVAKVPAGATTGPLNVQVGSANAGSVDDFIVTGDSAGAAPSIASFAPAVADSNTTVSVSGAGFAQGGGTQAGVNLDLASVTPASDTQLAFTPLSYALSGPVAVQTPYGLAQSASPLIVVPAAVGAGNVMSSAMLTVDGPTQPLNFSGSGKVAAAVFSVQAGQWLSLQFSQFTVSTGVVRVSVYDSAGNLFTLPSVQPNNLSVHLPPALLKGTYLVLLSSDSAATSQFRLGVESNPMLGTSAALSVATGVAGQSKRVVFSGSAGQNLGLGVTNMALAPASGNSITTRLFTPIGTQLTNIACTPSTGGCDLNILSLPATQTYGLVFTPAIAATMSFTATLSNDVTATLQPDVPYALNIGRSGQNARLTFTANAGQSFALLIGGASVSPANQVSFTILKPDGTQLAGTNLSYGGAVINLPNLPTTGTYTLFVDPTNAATASMNVTLGSGGSFTVDGAPVNAGTSSTGQPIYLHFNASAGQNLGLGLTAMNLTPVSVTNFQVTVYKPNGAAFVANSCYASYSGCELNLSNLPSTGTYAVIAAPFGAARMGFTATLSSDTGAALAVDTPYALNVSRAGQNGRMTFSPAAGQSFALLVGGASVTPANTVTVRVLKPDGSTLAATNLANGGAALDLVNLAPLTYTVFVDPANAATATMSVTLSSGSGVSVDGAPKAFSTSNTGQSAYFQFTANAGQNLGLALTGISITPSSGNALQVNVYKPDGSLFANNACYPSNSGCELNLSSLPSSGAYGVVVTPTAAATIGFTATLSSDVTATLALDTAYALNIARAGQNGRLTFTATAGQYAALLIGGANVTPSNSVLVKVLKPDGSQLTGTNLAYGGAGLNLPNLAAGTYTLFVDPAYAATATMTVTLSSGGGLSVGGSPAHVATSNSGQPVYFQFSGTAGQNLGLGATAISFAPSSVNYLTINVYKPDGNLWTTSTCFSGTAGCELNLSGLPASGTYSLVAAPSGAATLTFNLTLSADLVVALPSSSSTPMSLTRNGQNGRYAFSANAGGNVSIVISAIATAPANQYVSLKVLQPNGTQVTAANTQTGYTFNLTNLPVTGTYTVLVDPFYASTVNLNASKTP